MTTPGLRLEGVSFRGPDDRTISLPDLDVLPGTTLTITGPTGSGKSTVVAGIAGLVPLAAGRITLDGAPLAQGAAGYSSQQHDLIGALTAAENVALRLLATGRLTTGAWASIEQLLAELGLPESSWHNLLEQLSGGQQQRAAVARALVGSPPLICLDDPVSELDESSADTVWEAIARRAELGSIIVVVSAAPTSARAGEQTLTLH